MADPTFSVIIPTRGRPDDVATAVADVFAQAYPAAEVVVVVDGADLGTEERLRAFTDARLRVATVEHGGPGSARNAGAARASGEWLVFLDDDDRVAPDWLAVLAAMASDTRAGFVSCGVEVVGDGAVEAVIPTRLSSAFSNADANLLAGSFAVRRELFEASGGYDPAIRHGENWELGMRALDACRRAGRTTVADERLLVTVERRGRSADRPTDLREGALRVLDRDAALLADDPRHRAQLWGIAGVNAARLGDDHAARRDLWRAVRARPLAWRAWARLAVASVPPIARRVWPPPGRGAEGHGRSPSSRARASSSPRPRRRSGSR